jgi:hypothetical protein
MREFCNRFPISMRSLLEKHQWTCDVAMADQSPATSAWRRSAWCDRSSPEPIAEFDCAIGSSRRTTDSLLLPVTHAITGGSCPCRRHKIRRSITSVPTYRRPKSVVFITATSIAANPPPGRSRAYTRFVFEFPSTGASPWCLAENRARSLHGQSATWKELVRQTLTAAEGLAPTGEMRAASATRPSRARS